MLGSKDLASVVLAVLLGLSLLNVFYFGGNKPPVMVWLTPLSIAMLLLVVLEFLRQDLSDSLSVATYLFLAALLTATVAGAAGLLRIESGSWKHLRARAEYASAVREWLALRPRHSLPVALSESGRDFPTHIPALGWTAVVLATFTTRQDLSRGTGASDSPRSRHVRNTASGAAVR